MRCLRAKTDGWASFTFHSKCDGKGPTVTIIKVGSYIFGGYTDQSWGGKYGFLTAIFFTQFIHCIMVSEFRRADKKSTKTIRIPFPLNHDFDVEDKSLAFCLF